MSQLSIIILNYNVQKDTAYTRYMAEKAICFSSLVYQVSAKQGQLVVHKSKFVGI